MSPTFTERINVTRTFSDGSYEAIVNFTDNIASVQLATKPEYETTRQIIGTLIQFFGEISAQYDLYSGNDVIALDLPETTKLIFFPTSYLSDSYTLIISTAVVGNVVNANEALSIPQLLLELPSKVDGIQFEVNNLAIESTNLSGRTNALEIASLSVLPHIHPIGEVTGLTNDLALINSDIGAIESGLSALSTIPNRVTALESTTAAVASGILIQYISLSVNQALEKNKKYLATVSGLVCSLPPSASIGDVISLSTGNFPLRVNHGSASEQILNLSTLTTIGIDSGIILKAYSDIDLIYLGSNLWKTGYRSRVINNYAPESLSAEQPISFEMTASGNSPAYATTLAMMKNGIKAPTGSYQTDGYLDNGTALNLLVTSANNFALTKLNLYNGQGNKTLNATSDFKVDSCTIYRGNSAAGVNLGSVSFANNTGVEQAKTISNSTLSSQYFLEFASSSPIGILELELFGKFLSSGEVTAV